MKETELAQKFVNYLSNYDLWFEVDYYRSIDIVSINEKIISAYEVKLSFNFKVFEQALENKEHFNYSYICTTGYNSIQGKLCKDYGLGLLIFDTKGYGDVREYIHPKINRNADYKHLMKRIHDFNKKSIPGSKSGDCEKITAFKVTVENAVTYVKRHPGCTIKEMVEGIGHHYSTDERARASLYQWIHNGTIKELKIEKRGLFLNSFEKTEERGQKNI